MGIISSGVVSEVSKSNERFINVRFLLEVNGELYRFSRNLMLGEDDESIRLIKSSPKEWSENLGLLLGFDVRITHINDKPFSSNRKAI